MSEHERAALAMLTAYEVQIANMLGQTHQDFVRTTRNPWVCDKCQKRMWLFPSSAPAAEMAHLDEDDCTGTLVEQR